MKSVKEMSTDELRRSEERLAARVTRNGRYEGGANKDLLNIVRRELTRRGNG